MRLKCSEVTNTDLNRLNFSMLSNEFPLGFPDCRLHVDRKALLIVALQVLHGLYFPLALGEIELDIAAAMSCA